ncbi:MAG TPA: response regulator transcription factor [Candidatus Limnocylindrales bacterium]|nr:response regulator transcription factor [Candidatus Limnocylindrales bacterium]
MLRTQPIKRAPIAVLLVDELTLVRDALADALDHRDDMHVVGVAASLSELPWAMHEHPDVAIVDYSLPDGTGVDACRQIRARWPGAQIVMLSEQTGEAAILAALQSGALGYLSKGEHLSTVVRAVRDAHAGRPIVSPEQLGRIARWLGATEPDEQERHPEPAPASGRHSTSPHGALTARELAVLRSLANGHSTRQIAAELRIAEGTVRRHVEAIRGKLGVHTRLEAVSEAFRLHIVELLPA